MPPHNTENDQAFILRENGQSRRMSNVEIAMVVHREESEYLVRKMDTALHHKDNPNRLAVNKLFCKILF